MATSDFETYLARLDPKAAYLVLKPVGSRNRGKLLSAVQSRRMTVLEEVGFDEQGRMSQSVNTLVLKLQPTTLREFILELAREGLEGELTGYEVWAGEQVVRIGAGFPGGPA